jgi:hypothetical protein
MKKVRRNISLDADVEEAVDERAENFSGQVNEWAARRYRDGEFYVLDRALIGRMIDTVETHREEMRVHTRPTNTRSTMWPRVSTFTVVAIPAS